MIKIKLSELPIKAIFFETGGDTAYRKIRENLLITGIDKNNNEKKFYSDSIVLIFECDYDQLLDQGGV